MATLRRQRSRSFPSTAPAPIVNIAERRSKREPLHSGRKPTIFLAVPTVDGNVNFTIALLFGRALASSTLPECPFHFITHIEVGRRGIDYARNLLVKTFLEQSDADWLYMIDADQMVPENFWQLCTVKDADVVGAITPVWVGNMDAEAMLRVNVYGVDEKSRCFNLPIPDSTVKQPYRVPVLGTGCIAIRRRVFAPKPYGVGTNPFYFTHLEDRKVQGGEDVNFSVECNRAGFVLAAHPDVRFDHMKALPLWQVDAYAKAYHEMMKAGKMTTQEQRLSVG